MFAPAAPRSPRRDAPCVDRVSRVGLVACALLLAPTPARAAWETQVLSAAEPDDALDLHVGATFEHVAGGGQIAREWFDANGAPTDVRELDYKLRMNRLWLEVRSGVFRDLELSIRAPIVLAEDTSIAFAPGVEGRSTIIGSASADDPNAAGIPRFPITDVPGERFRGGFGDMIFGLAWSPANEKKDAAWPTITLRGSVTAPTGSVRVPSDVAALVRAERGGIGLGQTIFDLGLSASRKLAGGRLDPYVGFGVTLPVAMTSQEARGLEPPIQAHAKVGSEVVVYENAEYAQRYTLDLGFEARFVGAGRTYGELSDYLPSFDPTRVLANRSAADPTPPDEFRYADFARSGNYVATSAGARCGAISGVACGELNAVDAYLMLKGTLAASLRFAPFALLRAGVTIQHNTDHLITNERVGRDLDPENARRADGTTCDGAACSGRVNARNSFYDPRTNTCAPGKTCDERSPYFDPRYDSPGRRFRLEDYTQLTVFVSALATF